MDANFDKLLKQIEEDELRDQIDATLNGEVIGEQTKMTPIDYAKARGMQPQLVYYYIRTKKITQEKCQCGRWVLDIKQAEAFFAARDAKRERRV